MVLCRMVTVPWKLLRPPPSIVWLPAIVLCRMVTVPRTLPRPPPSRLEPVLPTIVLRVINRVPELLEPPPISHGQPLEREDTCRRDMHDSDTTRSTLQDGGVSPGPANGERARH